jgi:hypothetical protein
LAKSRAAPTGRARLLVYASVTHLPRPLDALEQARERLDQRAHGGVLALCVARLSVKEARVQSTRIEVVMFVARVWFRRRVERRASLWI